jgi:prepilin-type N-terminal cleavage/methylation domain-containing protein
MFSTLDMSIKIRNQNLAAFSLIEMIAVLSIIGLLVTIFTVGTSIRYSAAVRSTIREVIQYKISIYNFSDTYKSLPGDSINIQKFWPAACSSTGASTEPKYDCHGDGDDIIEDYISGKSLNESLLAWKQLKITQIIDGSFSGAGDGDNTTQSINVNVPKSKFPKGQYAILHHHDTNFPDEHMIILGKAHAGTIGDTKLLEGTYANNIDNKLDDNLPSSGIVYARNGHNGTDYSSNCLLDASDDPASNSEAIDQTLQYNLELRSAECILGFVITQAELINPSRSAVD